MTRIYDRGVGNAGQADLTRTQETARAGRTDGQRPASSVTAAGSDTVHLSAAAGRVRQALEASAGSRAQKVNALQAAYRSGSYVPDSHETSRAMVREALAGGAA